MKKASGEGLPRATSPSFEQEVVAGPSVIDELAHVSNIAYVGWIQDVAKARSSAVGWDSPAYSGALRVDEAKSFLTVRVSAARADRCAS